MKIKNRVTYLFSCLLIVLPLLVQAQVQITFPITRMVFQRNGNNEATVRIGGVYSLPFSRIEVRAEPMDGGTLVDWTTVQDNPQGGTFAGNLTMKGGWYRLKVRGLQGEQYTESGSVVERVGVGEVFVIAGQSNAQGFERFNGFGSPGASSDRVNCINMAVTDGNSNANDPNFPGFSHLDATSKIFPRGQAAWCWGRLGDDLVQRFGVPVLFFNAAFEGTSVLNWRESAEGKQTYEEFAHVSAYPYGGQYGGQPYANLKMTLQYYIHTLGVRAVLWHQGETDNMLNHGYDWYLSNLPTVIQKSREHSGKNISWVVSRVSYTDANGRNAGIINAQNQVIQTVGNVFAGPSTDDLQIPRASSYDDANVHIHDNGLAQLGDLWNASLNDDFFQRSTPQGPAAGPTLSIACAGNNSLAIGVNGGYSSITWNSGDNGQAIVKGQGRYMATVKDGAGNTLFTAPYDVPGAPSITANGPQTFCEGGNVTLTSTYDGSLWNNSSNGKSITVATGGNYQAIYRNVGGCDFTSNTIAVSVNPLPTAPAVTALRATRFCDRDTTVLQSTDALVYNWNTGEKAKQITVRRGGDFSLTVTDQNGCTSRQSNIVSVTVDPLPNRPTISSNGPTTFCADQTVTLTSSSEDTYVWQSGQASRSIVTNQAGSYSVRTRNIYGCLSDVSNTVTVRVNALPPAPTLTANGPTIFCNGNRVTLTVGGSLKAFWNVGDSTQSIVATTSGAYSARVRDANGCYSPSAPAIAVDVKPVPDAPVVQQIGTYTLEASGTRQGDYYQWQRDNAVTNNLTPIIKANQSGSYRAKAYLAYDSIVCESDYSAPITFTLINDNGGLSIYPNPSPDKQVTIETLDNLTNATVTLYTLSGQEVWSATVAEFNERKFWNLTIVPAGQYIVVVRANGFKVSKRLIVGL